MNKNERLKKVRLFNELTLAEFGRQINLTAGAVSDIERGRRNLTDRVVDDVCRVFSVQKDWLLYGDGEMLSADSSDEIEALVKRYDLSYGIQTFIEKLVHQPNAVQDAVIRLIVEIAAACVDVDPTSRPSDLSSVNPDDMISAAEAAYLKDLHGAAKRASTASSTTSEDENDSLVV